MSRISLAFDEDYVQLFQRSSHTVDLEPRLLEIAKTDLPVLIQGEAGVGKALIARVIHGLSARQNGPFLRVNCRALPEDLLAIELFGQEPGGPKPSGGHAGRIERAEGGTLLLEEIDDLPATLQTRLLRMLVEGEVFRVGGRALLRIDVRLITTAQESLRGGPRGRNRQLYDRLAIASVRIPPLRERREDIPSLLVYFIEKFASEFDRPGVALPPELAELCYAYAWPGNVSELEHFAKRLVVFGDEKAMREDLETRIRVAHFPATNVHLPGGLQTIVGLEEGLRPVVADVARRAEWAVIRNVLEEVHWNRAEAARRLKISYKTLLNKLKGGTPHVTRRPRPL